MKSRYIVVLGGILPLSACNSVVETDQRPNVVVILVDDLGKEWVDEYGAKGIELENINNLARQSIRFDRAYSMPQSTPSRVAMLTGQYPYNNGWINHFDVPRWGHGAHFDNSMNNSFARTLRDAGYKTCAAGKWQINDFRLQPEAMVEAGFDSYCMWTGGEGGNEEISESRYWNPYIHTKDGSRQYLGEFGPDIYNNHILDFITENRDNPFYIYYPMTLTHVPLVHTPHDMDATTKRERHIAMTKYMDYLVGRVVKTLEDNGLMDNTYIIFTTDNGTASSIVGMRDDRYIRGGKSLLSENGINCPFIVYAPGAKARVESNALVDFTDIAPTVLELAGVEHDGKDTLDGVSFAGVLIGESQGKSYALSMGSHPARIGEDGMVKSQVEFRDRAIMGQSYKIYLSYERASERIYDIANDPYEIENLVDDPKAMSVALEELGRVIEDLPTSDANPKYIPLEHNSDYDYDLNDENRRSTPQRKRPNFNPLATEQEYLDFK